MQLRNFMERLAGCACRPCSLPGCRKVFLAALAVLALAQVPDGACAKPRTKAAMKAAASGLFRRAGMGAGAREAGGVKELRVSSGYAVYGMGRQGFAVVATDDVAPAVLGYSTSAYRDPAENSAFAWWLAAVDEAVTTAAASGERLAGARPNRLKHAESVPYLCRSKWGQEAPYSDLCPTASSGRHCLTGCVATAMAQVLYYHRAPERGNGSATVYYAETPFTVNFGEDAFDWDNMLDSYSGGSYSEAEASAVALLMRNCGVASKMQYGTSVSLAYYEDAAKGLGKYFGIEAARYAVREDYDRQGWMDLIYDQLTNKMPVMYGGYDNAFGGHAFVVDGYDKEGLVHVNWGWNGSMDGYYDLSLLNPSSYSFSKSQDAIIDIKVEDRVGGRSDTLSVSQPGTLHALVGDERKYDYDTLKVDGTLSESDLSFLREMAGRDADGLRTAGNLRVLDLRGATLGGAKGSSLPGSAFRRTTLTALYLPEDLVAVGDGAWAFCSRLDSVYVPRAEGRDYVVRNSLVLTADGKEAVAALPHGDREIDVPEGVTVLHPYCFAGNSVLPVVSVPETVTLIGQGCFGDCYGLSRIKLYPKEVPALGGDSVFSGINKAVTKLYVPLGCKGVYAAAKQWADFASAEADNIVEFGSRLKVRNVSRLYGDTNPEFGYSTVGDAVSGVPDLLCEATEKSPVGRYPIHIQRGSVTDECVEFEDGYLIVRPAPLTAKAEDCSRSVGEANPDFVISYSGFKNGEDESVLAEKPTATCEAGADAPEGDYPIVVSGGSAPNYALECVNGTLFVRSATGISDVADSGQKVVRVYNMAGVLVRKDVCGNGDVVQWLRKLRLPVGVYVVNGRKYVVR